MKLDFFIELKYQSSSIILSVGSKYCMCERILWRHLPYDWRYASRALNDVNASSGISSPIASCEFHS